MSKVDFILGFDPSLNGTGYCVLDVRRKHPKITEVGTVQGRNKTWGEEDTTSVKLTLISAKTRELVAKYRPAYPSVFLERGFSNQFNNSTQAGFRARGALEAELVGFDIVEFPPTQVKKVIGKEGFAAKETVAESVAEFLNVPMETFANDNESDAAAVAVLGWLKHVKGAK
ncbi:crossover junction endodeoxyribonuclease RuvC (plasmid) [Paenibacillus peoriae]|uniref:Crossover junction endodeoxyribonuclease RuvC n=1 Tax=Paenibacillus peoriae TaxID=59893 RepID=A0A7H0YH00_9BACL|nr:crossover junction endodeoxyribonuclease RuvC [Paenibacillus peoriae]QNR70358.1 crossover junction endodeoxyribonuclease RuvC [Paenibacillus peoriae]